jgi:hypothetical protein
LLNGGRLANIRPLTTVHGINDDGKNGAGEERTAGEGEEVAHDDLSVIVRICSNK